MSEIVLKRETKNRKPKRTSVIVSPDTYIAVYQLAHEVGITVEQLVDRLLTEALKEVRIED